LGLFGYNFNKPGPGISKDQPKLKPFPLFFSILFRKFSELVKLNLLFCIPVLISLVIIYLLKYITNIPFILFSPIILISPFVAGLAFVTRNYVREEHAFIFSDFMDAVKQNFKAFLINGVICYFGYIIFSVAISYYLAECKNNSLFYFLFAVCIFVLIIFVFAQYYVPVSIVTFDLNLKQIYKNSLIFSIIGLWRNLLITFILLIVFGGLYILLYMVPVSLFFIVLFVFLFLFSFCMFLINFIVYPLIDKSMIQPFQKDREDDVNDNDTGENND
jgi:uncharacterized membrane protein YesL